MTERHGVLYVVVVALMVCVECSYGQVSARKLYDTLLHRKGYTSTARPATYLDEPVVLYMNITLIQILEVEEKNQVINLNVWVNMLWKDPNFVWNPAEFGGVDVMHIPANQIWTPDLVLYNNAGGNWDMSSSSNTKVAVHSDGKIIWKPPIIFNSQCAIDVEFFPFDTQRCMLKLGTWTHNGCVIDLRHMTQIPSTSSTLEHKKDTFDACEAEYDYAIDLSHFVENKEWDLMSVKAKRFLAKYACCTEPYVDIRFYVKIRRRILFYGINLICPCLAISFLTLLVFCLPADCSEKMTLSISVLLALTVFFLLIFDISPATSLVVPLILKYLLFSMILVTLSVLLTVIILNVHCRTKDTHDMSPWVRKLFLKALPRILFMRAPEYEKKEREQIADSPRHIESAQRLSHFRSDDADDNDNIHQKWRSRRAAIDETQNRIIDEIELALDGVRNIANHIKEKDEAETVKNDWKYVSVVLDRLFLYLFTLAAFIGAAGIFLQAPTLTDSEMALTADDNDRLRANAQITRNCTLPAGLVGWSCST